MKHINQLLLELVDDMEQQSQHDADQNRREAARQGIAEARRILGETPDPERLPEKAA